MVGFIFSCLRGRRRRMTRQKKNDAHQLPHCFTIRYRSTSYDAAGDNLLYQNDCPAIFWPFLVPMIEYFPSLGLFEIWTLLSSAVAAAVSSSRRTTWSTDRTAIECGQSIGTPECTVTDHHCNSHHHRPRQTRIKWSISTTMNGSNVSSPVQSIA